MYFQLKSADVIKKSADVSKICYQMGVLNVIFCKELVHSYKMRGQPLLYYKCLKSYISFSKRRIFAKKSVDIINKKVLTSAK